MIDNDVAWPSVIKYEGAEELLFVGSERDWLLNPEIVSVQFQAGDLLIDSDGQVYSLAGKGPSALQGSSEQLSLEEVLDLVRQHASVCGHCCVSKMGAPSIGAALQLVEVIE